jgi:hypothetical protein
MASAQAKMKAPVISGFLLRDISNWTAFAHEWQAAGISSPAAALQAILVGGAAAMLKQESIDGTAALARRVVSLLVRTR